MSRLNSDTIEQDLVHAAQAINKINEQVKHLILIRHRNQRRIFQDLQDLSSLQSKLDRVLSCRETAQSGDRNSIDLSTIKKELTADRAQFEQLPVKKLNSSANDIRKSIISIFRSFPYEDYRDRHPCLKNATKKCIFLYYATKILSDFALLNSQERSCRMLTDSLPLDTLLIRYSELEVLSNECTKNLSQIDAILNTLQLDGDKD